MDLSNDVVNEINAEAEKPDGEFKAAGVEIDSNATVVVGRTIEISTITKITIIIHKLLTLFCSSQEMLIGYNGPSGQIAQSPAPPEPGTVSVRGHAFPSEAVGRPVTK